MKTTVATRTTLPRRYVIAREKIVEYLLNDAHPIGGPKARFLTSFGFSRDRPRELADALVTHPSAPQHSALDESTGGRLKLIYEGPIPSPDGRSPNVRAVWMLEGDGTARFVTCVPLTP